MLLMHLNASLFCRCLLDYKIVTECVCLFFRKEWDVFVVAAAHPEGSPVPQDWVQPEVPSDHLWASSLHTPTHGT